MFKNIRKLEDGSFIIEKNGYDYHVYNGGDYLEEYNQLTQYIAENPNAVTDYKIDKYEPSKEELAEQIRAKRDYLINAELWKLQRHEQEKALGIDTTLTDEEYIALLKYIQALRELPQQLNFPNTVIYPEKPE